MALVKTVEMRVLAKAGDAQAQLDEIAAKGDELQANGIRMRFRVDGAEGKAQLDEIRARADALGFKDVSIKVKVDGAGRAIADLAAVKHEMDSVERQGIMNRIGNFFGGAGGGIPGAVGPLPLPALAAAIPVVGALATEAVGLASGFAAAGAGAGAFALLALPAVRKVEKALSDIQKGKSLTALHLTVDEKGAVTGIEKLKATFGKISTAFQPAAFKVFNDALKVANNLLPHITPFANTFAKGLDGLLKQLGKFTASKGFSDWLKQFHSLEGPAIQSIGTGIGKVATAFGHLMTIMSGKDVGHAINIAFGAIAGTINGVASGLHRFMQNWDGMSAAAAKAGHAIEQAFSAIGGGAVAMQRTVDHAFAEVASGVAHGVMAAIHVASELPGKIRGLFAGAGGWLVQAGRNIIEGLIHGIESMAGAVGSAISHIASTIRSFLPFSPAKQGPLSGGGSPDIAGRKIVAMLADGMDMSMPAIQKMAEKAAKTIADRIKAETALAKSVSGATLSGLGLTSIDLSQTTVAGGMQSYLASIKAFIGEIKQLTSMHLNKGILQQLIQAGPVTGGQYAQSILQGGGVGQVNALYAQIQKQSALLGAQAAMSLYGGKVSPKGDTYNVSVSAGLVTDKQSVALEIVKLLRAYKRHGGGAALGLS